MTTKKLATKPAKKPATKKPQARKKPTKKSTKKPATKQPPLRDLLAAKLPKTTNYYGWMMFEDFCEEHGLEAMPASAATVARYIAEAEVNEKVRTKLLDHVIAAQRAAGVSEGRCAELRNNNGAPITKTPELTYLTAGSRSGGKFWEVEVVDCEVRTRYGKHGTAGSTSSKRHASPAAAADDATRQTRAKLRKGYTKTPRPKTVSASSVSLAKTTVEGTFYFRALDRWPGGNADMFVIKAVLVASPGAAPQLSATWHRNFDGQHFAYTAKTLALPDAKANAAAVLSAAQQLIDHGSSEGAFTVREPRKDNEEYDTEWSSLEHSLQIDGTPVVRLTQKATTSASKSTPDATSQQFFDAVFRLFALDRVQPHADGLSALSAAFRKAGKGGSLGYGQRTLPLYL